ncbi:coatomer subunit beta-like [Oscarella lobularis]|uniref:coatomer subunit beta-like n=1 Tax=Oscarella lobularis TaxID=121494 RepID=UPI003313D186
MTAAEQACYTLLNVSDDSETPNEMQLRQDLQKGDTSTRIATVKTIIQMILNGEKMPGLLMPMIQYAMPTDDHLMKKLLLVFFEIVPKTQPDGKLLHEMILVCDAYRRDLQHPNEYIRGSTLRFLCKLKEPELLEPLMPAIRQCLEHRHAYVRRNAVLAIYTIYKSFDYLISDAPELMQDFLEKEQDASCKRNAFMMLIHVDQERALDYLSTCIDQVHTFNDILQLVIVELVYKVCFANPSERVRFIRCIYNLLNSSSSAVRYEAAGTLVTLSSAPAAVKAASICYVDLIVKESDNNVKLIVLDRLIELRENPSHERVLQDLVMDILRVLSSTDLEVRSKCLDLVLDLISSRNIEEVVLVLKKEVSNTTNEAGQRDDVGSYRQLLVRTLHSCSIKFPDVAPSVIPVLLEFLSDTNEDAAADVLVFVREAIQKSDSLRPTIVNRLLDEFHRIKSQRIHQATMWILGEYCVTVPEIRHFMDEIKKAVGEVPMVDSELRKAAAVEESDEAPSSSSSSTSGRMLVTADGTYATQSAYTAKASKKGAAEKRPILRGYLLDGDFYVGSVLGSTLTKLALRFLSLVPDPAKQNAFCGESMLIVSSMIHLGKSGLPKQPIADDDLDQLMLCIRVMCDRSPFMIEVFNRQCRSSLSMMLAVKEERPKVSKAAERRKAFMNEEADDPISFVQLVPKQDGGTTENQFEASLLQAVGTAPKKTDTVSSKSQLNKVHQLTGFSDPVYAEAYVHVNQFDIILDVLVVNQTTDTLQGLTVELATLGDLKLVEKPMPLTLGPHDFCNIKASVKVASTENGIIFGNIVYDVSGGQSDRNCVILNDIHIDIMDYIVPAHCSDSEFRKMWAEFEWENKVTVSTNITGMQEYLKHLLKCTNMQCLTPEEALSGDCGFMAANLYARSIFGEDALANLSIEKGAEGAPVTGHIRIRAKSQGMALSLGDKINLSQKVQK